MENLNLLLTDDLIAMLSKQTKAQLSLTDKTELLKSREDILQLQRLIEWRKLTGSHIYHSTYSKLPGSN